MFDLLLTIGKSTHLKNITFIMMRIGSNGSDLPWILSDNVIRCDWIGVRSDKLIDHSSFLSDHPRILFDSDPTSKFNSLVK